MKLTYTITGLSIEQVRLFEAAENMAIALQDLVAWFEDPSAERPPASKLQSASAALTEAAHQ